MRRLVSIALWITAFLYIASHLSETGAAIINIITV